MKLVIEWKLKTDHSGGAWVCNGYIDAFLKKAYLKMMWGSDLEYVNISRR